MFLHCLLRCFVKMERMERLSRRAQLWACHVEELMTSLRTRQPSFTQPFLSLESLLTVQPPSPLLQRSSLNLLKQPHIQLPIIGYLNLLFKADMTVRTQPTLAA